MASEEYEGELRDLRALKQAVLQHAAAQDNPQAMYELQTALAASQDEAMGYSEDVEALQAHVNRVAVMVGVDIECSGPSDEELEWIEQEVLELRALALARGYLRRNLCASLGVPLATSDSDLVEEALRLDRRRAVLSERCSELERFRAKVVRLTDLISYSEEAKGEDILAALRAKIASSGQEGTSSGASEGTRRVAEAGTHLAPGKGGPLSIALTKAKTMPVEEIKERMRRAVEKARKARTPRTKAKWEAYESTDGHHEYETSTGSVRWARVRWEGGTYGALVWDPDAPGSPHCSSYCR